MKNSLIRLFALLLLCSASFPQTLLAAERKPASEAGNRVMSTIDEVRAAVKAAQGTQEDSLTLTLEKIIFPVFNFEEMSRRSLGKNWKEGTKEQQVEFVDEFSKLLSRTYLNRIRQIENSTVEFVGEKVKGDRALVKTNVTKDGQTFPITYRLRNYKDGWKVYDVVIENISLVSNYREDFASVVRNKKFSGLLEMIREKNGTA